MRTKHTWTGLRMSVLCLGLCATLTSGLSASPSESSLSSLMQFGTSGQIGTTGITGPNVISYVPVGSGSFTTPSAFSLGTFVVGYQPQGTVTSYDHTPFSITYTAQKVNGTVPTPNETPITITGFLNGSVSGPDQSNVVATFDPIATPNFITGDYANTLSVLDPQVSLVPSTTNSGQTTAQAHLEVVAAPSAAVPEPATIAFFLTTIAGLGLRHRFRRLAV
ncbi:MAG TPA: PEP-CTERM sorting domain-containing protein [Isosphaeraceae bacterium]|nr:PEP-CTERM sorting domain-containing protein [Isosphaeraceae bacterium]